MFVFYTSSGSSALATHILLEEIGAPYEVRNVPISEGAHLRSEYLAINPKGRVPALADGKTVVTETPAILTYLAEVHPEKGLLPDDARARARVNEIAAYLCATMHVAFAHKFRAARWTDDEAAIAAMQAKVPQNLRDCAGIIEEHYLIGPWALGDGYSILDPYMFLVHRWLKGGEVDISDFPKIAAHRDAMMDRPATRAALAAQEM